MLTKYKLKFLITLLLVLSFSHDLHADEISKSSQYSIDVGVVSGLRLVQHKRYDDALLPLAVELTPGYNIMISKDFFHAFRLGIATNLSVDGIGYYQISNFEQWVFIPAYGLAYTPENDLGISFFQFEVLLGIPIVISPKMTGGLSFHFKSSYFLFANWGMFFESEVFSVIGGKTRGNLPTLHPALSIQIGIRFQGDMFDD